MTTINQLLFICLFAGCFFIPGWFLLKALNLRRHRFLLSLSLSYALLIITLTALQHANLSTSLFAPFILGASILCGALWLARFAWVRYFRNEAPRGKPRVNLLCRSSPGYAGQVFAESCEAKNAILSPIVSSATKDPHCSKPQDFLAKKDEQNRSLRSRAFRFRPGILVPFAAVMGLVWVYLWWAGPYLEIPADAWNHVRFFWDAKAQMHAGQFSEATASLSSLLLHQGKDWYLIIEYLMQWSGISIPRVLTPLTIMTVSTFCAGIFFCALAVFRPFRVSIWKRGWMAAGATLFCAVTMGTSVFAYIRYYALAPTILNYLLFLSATLIALDWLNTRKWWTNAVWLIPALVLTMNVVHSQEVLFTCFMIMGLALVNVCTGISCVVKKSPSLWEGRYAPRSICFAKSLIVAGIAIIAWLGLFYWLRHKNPIIWPDAHTIMPNMPIPPVSVPLVFKAFTISLPAHPVVRLCVYQFYTFYQTIGCWGFFVYIAFLLGFRQMAKSNYLLAGMAMPLLTVFNPITIDLFVRLITLQSPDMPPVAIYRLNYMLPLPFVAAFALGNAVESLTRRTGHQNTESFGRRSNAVLIKAIIIIIGLVGLIFPIQNRWIDAPFSRVYTLTKHFGNDVGRWQDLIDFVAGFQNPMLITDPNTCQIFSRLYPGYPSYGLQWINSNDPEAQFLEATKQQPELLTRGIVIINRRDGVPSVTGRISKHWPEDAFLTSHFYLPKAIAFVESNTNRFKLLWAKDQIEVFQIIP